MADTERHEPGDDFATLKAEAARLMLLVSPNIHTLRLVGIGADGKTVIPIPLPGMPEDLEGRILAALGTLPKNERMSGRVLAATCNVKPTQGNFQRTVARLRDAGKVDAHKLYGYKLA